jgi:Glycosyl transferase family 2
MPNRPLFSILHTSARPNKWKAVYDDWLSKAAHPEDVEYVLCVDERWGFPRGWGQDRDEVAGLSHPSAGFRIVWNEGRRCYVDGVNTAAAASTGRILIVNADDQFACEAWDQRVIATLFEHDFRLLIEPSKDDDRFVIEISTGTPQEHERAIMVMPILSRARYEDLGYVFFPQYESMFADNDFCEHARQDGIVIDARHLVFPHRHPLFIPGTQSDAAYEAQNSKQAFCDGQALLMRRRASKFGKEPLPESKVIALCIAGELVQLDWMLSIMALRDDLQRHGWTVVTHSAYTTNVYMTRMLNAQSVLTSIEHEAPRPDFVLWIDDDNIVSFAHVAKLLEDLKVLPSVQMAAGWCWICSTHDNAIRTSCGNFSGDGAHLTHFDNETWAKAREIRRVDWTGFPCVLMRYSFLAQMGAKAFLPILDDVLEFGIGGEDASFCKRAIDAGHEIIADPRVKVQHVKPRAIEPFFPERLNEPKVAAMLRVHNERRWIRRVVESLKGLCGTRIYLLDDESTDDTADLAAFAGATVFRDPFPGMELDEARDKDWLLSKVVDECDPDWVLCIDGDEELEPLGAEKILSVIRQPMFDCYGLKFLNLWDSPDQIRVDRWYSQFSRQGLFRPSVAMGFKCGYEGCGTHSGLHVSNAPAGVPWCVLQVSLLHYGYMFKEDRIRKYRYYNRIDPNNEIEDCYRHTVQGDLPEVPADAVLKHAGPLELRKLPASMVPKFEIEPEPVDMIPVYEVPM